MSGGGVMKCPNCGKEMRNGYLFCSKDGAFSFANEVPGDEVFPAAITLYGFAFEESLLFIADAIRRRNAFASFSSIVYAS